MLLPLLPPHVAASAERGRLSAPGPPIMMLPAMLPAPPADWPPMRPLPLLARLPKSEPSMDAERRSGLRRSSAADDERRIPPGATKGLPCRCCPGGGGGPAAASCIATCMSMRCSSSGLDASMRTNERKVAVSAVAWGCGCTGCRCGFGTADALYT